LIKVNIFNCSGYIINEKGIMKIKVFYKKFYEWDAFPDIILKTAKG
jgi:hypothetical protein